MENKPVVYYFIPHQDDEVLSFGVSILNHTKTGQDVKVIYCTDGSKSSVRKKLEEGLVCEEHRETHRVSLTEEEFTDARDREAIESCKHLGVKESNIHFAPIRIVDGQATVEGCKHIIKEYMKLAPEAKVKTFTPYGAETMHKDHKALGKAALELYNEGIIKDMRFYIEPYEIENFRRENPSIKDRIETADEYGNDLVKALNAYGVWYPCGKRYAIGHHSVKKGFDDAQREKLNYVHSPID